MHISVSKLTIIGSDNGLSLGQHQAIIWTNPGILLIWTLGTNFCKILSKIHKFSFKKIHLTMLCGKWQPFCLGLNVLNIQQWAPMTFPWGQFCWKYSWHQSPNCFWKIICLKSQSRSQCVNFFDLVRHIVLQSSAVITRCNITWYHLEYLGILLCMRPANERWRHNVMSSLTGWVHTQNDPWILQWSRI